MSPKKIAIIGSGCSGLAALWALHTSTDHEVHLLEASYRLGGHTNTVRYRHKEETVMVDTGFIVLNQATYRE
jgi:predicted NAD/FAD-binding protein